jgi:ribosomal-protein-alanine N-acetyltransferase
VIIPEARAQVDAGRGKAFEESFTTARLRLDPTRECDLDSLHAIWTEPGVRRYLWDDVIIPREKVEETLRASLASFARDGFGLWALRLTGDQDLIGFAGLRRIAELPLEVELLYGLHPRFWKRGLATEASDAVLERGFARHGLERIWARADAPNAASFRVMKRLGMTRCQGPGSASGIVCHSIRREEHETRRFDTRGEASANS